MDILHVRARVKEPPCFVLSFLAVALTTFDLNFLCWSQINVSKKLKKKNRYENTLSGYYETCFKKSGLLG